MLKNALIILVLLILTFVDLFVLPVIMTRVALNRVIKILRRQDALNPTSARTPQDLGLAPPGFFDRMMKPRDYKPQALQYLKEAGIVHSTVDGRLYLSQTTLNEELRCKNLLGRKVRSILKGPAGRHRES